MTEIIETCRQQFYRIGISLPPEGFGVLKTNFRNVPPLIPDAWTYPSPSPISTARFRSHAETRIINQVQLPGKLMARGVLNLQSISDENVMLELIGEEIIDGMVIGTNGRGLPENSSIESISNFGLKAVKDLIEYQLQGTLELISGPGSGVSFRLQIPLHLYKKRI